VPVAPAAPAAERTTTRSSRRPLLLAPRRPYELPLAPGAAAGASVTRWSAVTAVTFIATAPSVRFPLGAPVISVSADAERLQSTR
jgi:hypothetical protein